MGKSLIGSVGVKLVTDTVCDLDEQGQIHGYSDTQFALPVGDDNQVLTSLASEASGLKWATATGMSIGSEQSTTPESDTSETQLTAGERAYSFFNVGSAGELILITGIEWKNGTNADGAVSCGVDKVNADPPTIAGTQLVAYAPPLSGGSTGTIERQSDISSLLLHGGETYGAWVQPDDTNREFRRDNTVANENRIKQMSGGVDPPNIENTAWTASTAGHYCIVYYRIIS